MKSFILFILLAFCVYYVEAQELSDLDLHDLQLGILKNDTIKSLSLYKYDITKSGGKIDSTLIGRSIFAYGINGTATEHIESIDRKKSTFYDYTCVYNNANQVIKRTIAESKNTKRGTIFEYEYDASGRQISLVKYNLDTTAVTAERRAIDEKGRWVATFITYNNLRIAAGQSTFKLEKSFQLEDSLFYDDKGRLGIKRHYSGSGEVISEYLYEYDGDSDQLIVTITKQERNTQHIIAKNKYNKYGQVIQSMSMPFHSPFDPHSDKETVQKLFYNPNGSINTCISYYNGKVDTILKYYYTKL